MTRTMAVARAALLLMLAANRVSAQEHVHSPGATEKLGAVHFATSCRPSAAQQFDRAVALLHSFEFGASIHAFNDVLATDSTCAMAYWGIALSRWSNPMAPGNRAPAVLELGGQAAATATRFAAGATEREREYVSAVSRLYADHGRVSQRDRVVAYKHAMAGVVARQPADTEARIFYAIALVASAPPTDKSYANQRKAGAILEALWAAQPNHPGLAHYIIHSYDVSALAPQATRAAQRYAEIAPSAAHALHMPSHTFTRVGLWKESVNTNLRSIEVAMREGSIAEALHASDYAEYAYLQMRQDSAARAVVLRLPKLAAKFDVNAITGAAPGSAGVFALAAIPARYALERRAWAEATSLRPNASDFPYTEAMTFFARALGAAHVGQPAIARASIDSLAAIRERLLGQNEAYWAEQVAIEQLGAQAWLDLAEGRRARAVLRMREAARREDATEKSAVSPGPLTPARELLGDMLVELRRPVDALQEYRESLMREPNRFRTLFGAKNAAAAAGNHEAESRYAAQLQALTRSVGFAPR